MRKLVFLICSTITLIGLTGCSYLEEFINTTKITEEKQLAVKDEKISSDNENYIFSFTIEDADTINNLDGKVDIEIRSNYSTLYEEEETFTIETEDTTADFSFTIKKEDISDSSKSTGEFNYSISVSEYGYSSSLDISGLKVGEVTTNFLSVLIDSSTNEAARDNIKANSWNNYDNADINNMLLAYDELNYELKDFMLNGKDVTNGEEFIEINVYSYGLSVTQVHEIWAAVIHDNPIYYFVDKSVGTKSSGTRIYSFVLFVASPFLKEADRIEYNNDIIDYVNDCDELIEDATTDLEKSLLIHDKIIEDIDYDTTFNADFCYNILGVMAFKGPVCESYAETYLLLLTYYDIPCHLVVGLAGDDDENHAWNLIQIEGKWYWVDVTWDDAGKKGISYNYFARGLDDTVFENSHTANNNELSNESGLISYMIELPTVSSTSLTLE